MLVTSQILIDNHTALGTMLGAGDTVEPKTYFLLLGNFRVR